MDPKCSASIRIAFIVEGTRGDIQPYLALALTLQERGNTVKIFTNIDHKIFCDSFHIASDGVFYNMSEFMARPNVRNILSNGNVLKLGNLLDEMVFEQMGTGLQKLWTGLDEYQPTVLVTGSLSKSKSIMYSFEKTIPMIVVGLQAIFPVSDKAPSGLPTLPFGLNKVWFQLILAVESKIMTKTKEITKERLGIDMNGKYELPVLNSLLTDIPSFPGPVCCGISTFVIPKHPEWPSTNFYPCGFFTMTKQQQQQQSMAVGKDDGDDEDDGNATTTSTNTNTNLFGSEESNAAWLFELL